MVMMLMMVAGGKGVGVGIGDTSFGLDRVNLRCLRYSKASCVWQWEIGFGDKNGCCQWRWGGVPFVTKRSPRKKSLFYLPIHSIIQ